MADQQMAAVWPAPPPFYKNFTKANNTELNRFRKQAGLPSSTNTTSVLSSTVDDNGNGDTTSLASTSAGLDITSLPPELRYLLPPPPPPENKYKSFGSDIDLNAPPMSLASAGVEQLFPTSDAVAQNPQPYLLTLSRSLLTKFLELAGVLSLDPTKGLERTQDLRTMMNNMHFLINQYRPHQARETMILVFEERIARLREEVMKIHAARKKVEEVLDGIGRLSDESVATSEGKDMDGDTQMESQVTKEDYGKDDKSAEALRSRAKQRTAWAALTQLDEGPDMGAG